ncbi:glycosyltransferase family 2 protein [Bacteroides rodentium]
MKISVCIATYNGGKYLKEQLDSILSQLNDGDEIIVSDDSSTDNTLEIVDSYQDKRIKVLPNQKFHSPIFNFENALQYANGDYIFLSDQDDVWLPSKVKQMVAALEAYDLVVSNCKIVDGNLHVIKESFFAERKSGNGFWRNLIRNSYLGCCMAFKREILKYVLPFPKKIAMHDIWIGLSVELRGKALFMTEPLMLYRRHGGNVSYGEGGSRNTLFYQLKYRIQMLCFLLERKFFS